MERTDLIESIGNLLELRLRTKLSENGIDIERDTLPSQVYYFTREGKRIYLNNDELGLLFSFFSEEFGKYGLGCIITYNCIALGISHLSTGGLEAVVTELKK